MSDDLIQIQGTKPSEPRTVLPRPPWIKVRLSSSPVVADTRALMRRLELNTVCEEAACPNIGEC